MGPAHDEDLTRISRSEGPSAAPLEPGSASLFSGIPWKLLFLALIAVGFGIQAALLWPRELVTFRSSSSNLTGSQSTWTLRTDRRLEYRLGRPGSQPTRQVKARLTRAEYWRCRKLLREGGLLESVAERPGTELVRRANHSLSDDGGTTVEISPSWFSSHTVTIPPRWFGRRIPELEKLAWVHAAWQLLDLLDAKIPEQPRVTPPRRPRPDSDGPRSGTPP